ncbi:hypothetical protein [Thalassovita sp.]|jgi:hypothetical protein|uniref:hypothetical protein n=1 Tax=Thalassovita sp. TaxID=1979401 RepID=UPI003B58D175
MAKDLRIILHLGPHKTGSTSIQRSLFSNKGVLAEHGVHFLGQRGAYKNLYSAFMTDPMRDLWNRRSRLSAEQIEKRDENVRWQLFKQLKSLSGTAILSNEFLCLMRPAELARIHAALSEYGEVHALYYYRELLPWMASNSQQMAKVGEFFRPTAYATSIRRIHRIPLNIKREFGADRTHFIKFEDAVKQGLCNSLLREFNLPDFDTLGLSESRENESLSAPAVRAMYLYNLQNPPGSGRRTDKEISERWNLPGDKYRIDGLRPHEIRDYAKKRTEVSAKLGFHLVPPQDIPRSRHLDKENARQIWPYLPLKERVKALLKSLRRF